MLNASECTEMLTFKPGIESRIGMIWGNRELSGFLAPFLLSLLSHLQMESVTAKRWQNVLHIAFIYFIMYIYFFMDVSEETVAPNPLTQASRGKNHWQYSKGCFYEFSIPLWGLVVFLLVLNTSIVFPGINNRFWIKATANFLHVLFTTLVIHSLLLLS